MIQYIYSKFYCYYAMYEVIMFWYVWSYYVLLCMKSLCFAMYEVIMFCYVWSYYVLLCMNFLYFCYIPETHTHTHTLYTHTLTHTLYYYIYNICTGNLNSVSSDRKSMKQICKANEVMKSSVICKWIYLMYLCFCV